MLEIIGMDIKDCIIIEENGGDRIELIQSLSEGGLTPSYGLVKRIMKEINIPISVMIRPHSHTFKYNIYDIETMKDDAKAFYDLGVKQIVIGILDENDMPNIKALDYILEGLDFDVTFHRAIDATKDYLKAVRQLNHNKHITHILTSGGPGRAVDNVENLKRAIKENPELTIIVSGRVNASNIPELKEKLQTDKNKNVDFHIGTGVREGLTFSPIYPEQLRNAVRVYKEGF